MAPDPDVETTIHVIGGMLIGLLLMFAVWLFIFDMSATDILMVGSLPILLLIYAFLHLRKSQEEHHDKSRRDNDNN